MKRHWPGVVFTDLDGTLLDHHDYSWAAAAQALQALRRNGIPLILCSSKTRVEMLKLQRDLGICGPLISENGGGVFAVGGEPWADLLPQHMDGMYAKVFGTPYSVLRGALLRLREDLAVDVQGFGDTDDAGVQRWTGLSLEAARLAQQRDFDEPFLWRPEPTEWQVERARSLLAEQGLHLTRGGRFWHLMGDNDKGKAVQWLLQRLAECAGSRLPSLALGDSENDLPMLQTVDVGVLVERPGGGHLNPRPDGLRTVNGEGPTGWNRAVLEWLHECGIGSREVNDG